MTGTESQRLHERIDDLTKEWRDAKDTLTKEIAQLTTVVKESNALCSICRPMVIGNGRGTLGERVTKLETYRSVLWAGIGLIATPAIYGIVEVIKKIF